MLQKLLVWGSAVADLGRMYVYSRQPHIEQDLPEDLGPGLWIAIATKSPIQRGEPVYGTPAYKAVEAGQRYWVFLDEGEYWVYAVLASEPATALRAFYAEPDRARLLESAAVSAPGFRAEIA